MKNLKISFKEYLLFLLTILFLSLIILLIIIFFSYNNNFENAIINRKNPSISYGIDIIKNNLKNFMQYFLLFFISPILIFLDLFITIYTIYINYRVEGFSKTISYLIYHGIIEFLNLSFYMYLSLKSLLVLIYYKNIRKLIEFWKLNYVFYIYSIIALIIAGIIEGMVL